MLIERKVELNKPINHIAFIMDGNGRWANARGLPRYLGHKEACERIIEVFEYCKEYGIKVISFYCFSTENWSRPKAEINHLFKYLEIFFKKQIDYLISDGVKVIVSGDISRLPIKTQTTCLKAIELTKNNNKHVMNLCLNYGGQDEIVRASKLIVKEAMSGKLDIDSLSNKDFEKYLYTEGLPNVDLLVRTSGEQRISNFLLWQLAYAEFVFTPTYWPDFKKDQFLDCLEEFNNRNRRYGGLKNEK